MEEYDSLEPPRSVSYLQARDPSILSGNIGNCRINLNNYYSRSGRATSILPIQEISEGSYDPTIPFDDQLENPPKNKYNGLNVHLRIKGTSDSKSYKYEIENNTFICTVPESSNAARNKRNDSTVLRKYKFTKIFGPETTQAYLFDDIIKEKVLSFINGTNSTVLAYGASGSGKTFTMIGTEGQPGIIPRSLDYFFRTVGLHVNKKPILKPLHDGCVQLLSESQAMEEMYVLKNILSDSQSQAEQALHSKTFNHMQTRLSTNKVGTLNKFTPIVGVWVSFAEIYNENIYDLLQPHLGRHQQRPRLRIGGLQEDTYIRGLKYVFVQSGLEAYRVLHYGMHNLSYASTAVNDHSSRSHCIFSIRLVAGFDEKNCKVSVFNFCDLAGSERLKKTLNVGDRLKESVKINSSLSVLGRCISSIRDMQQGSKGCTTVPYRDSKLTILFQKALQGKEDILMIVNINSSVDMYDDTQHVLAFSAIAQEITTKVEHQFLKPSRYSVYNPNLSNYLLKEDEEEDERDREIQMLRDERADLILELSRQKDQFEAEMEAERKFLIENKESILKLRAEHVRKLREENKQLVLVNTALEKKVNQLKSDLIEREVISLDTSDEESDDEETLDKNKNFEMKIDEYQLEIQQLKVRNEKLSKEIKELNDKYQQINRDQSEQIQELKDTLSDSRRDFAALFNELEIQKKTIQKLTSENIMLSEQMSIQKSELDDLRQQNRILREECEQLETCNEVTQPIIAMEDRNGTV